MNKAEILDTSITDKRIAKNTIFLYIRMLLIMLVTLYTSRVVLATLGVEDFGIYNVVGGIVTMFSFLNGTISSVTQRFLTYELGTRNVERIKSVFNTAMCLHWIIAAIIVVLAETIGLWFLCNKLVISDERMYAAFWVYQFSILSTVVFIISVPYNACIIAHEKMSAFAYISIAEVVLKLLLVFLLKIFDFDKLIFYALLVFIVQLLIRMIYNVYCKQHFKESRYKFHLNREIAKSMIGFTGWSLFGGFASVGLNQGINIVLNLFFGPLVNSARAIAVQIDSAVQGFVSNFQMALNPPLIKNYASGKMENLQRLVYISCRYSYFLLFTLSLPILFETDIILKTWLVDVPEHALPFTRLILIILLVECMSKPIMTTINATGKIRNYQFVVGTLQLLVIPFSYSLLLLFKIPELVFVVYLVIAVFSLFVRLYMVKNLVGLTVKNYIFNVIRPVVFVTFCSIILPFVIFKIFDQSFLRLFFVGLSSLISTCTAIYLLGINEDEKIFINQLIRKIFCK